MIFNAVKIKRDKSATMRGRVILKAIFIQSMNLMSADDYFLV